MNSFQEIFNKQKAYFDSDATKSYEWRIDQLTRLENLCNENGETLEAAMSSDFKTASQEKVFEIMAPVGTAAFAKQELKEWMKAVDVVVPKALRESGHTAKVYREPYGVTLVIGPFNGPLTLLFDPACQVLAAGNPCILKLSEGLPATSKVLLDLIPKYFDPRAVTAVTGSKDEVTELLKLPFDFIFFTGSVKVGKIVMEAAAKNLTPVLLELGGQNPAFVDATANIPDAAKKIVWGATAWGGQWCTSPGYAYVHESIAEAFVRESKKAVIELYGTDPKSRSDDYSRIISPKAVDRFVSLIDQSKVVAGGSADREARYLDPTILYPVTWDDPIMEDEIFGPILPILTYKDMDAAIREVKKHPKPLSGFLFSRDQKAIDHFLASLSFGGGAINQVNIHLFIETMPFGGVGYSGIGHYYGKAGFDALTHAKSVLISPPDVAIQHLFPPCTEERSKRSASGLNTRPQRSPTKRPPRSTEMKTNAKDYVSIAQQFFTAYDAHEVDGMLALCADGALGRYAPYGRESVVPIRGGIDVIWSAFPNAVPNFRVKVIELIPAEGNTVVIQAEMSGPIPAEVPGVAKKGQDVHIPHCYILRFDTDSKITRLDAYWDNTVLNSIKASGV
ncbi:MAG: aldehyde dehydrogenase family protein [Candidatus Acidiferrum sp.]